jgi:hypothetical protein
MEGPEMESERFDAVTRRLSTAATRRGVLGVIAGMVGLGLGEVAAKRHRKKRARSPRQLSAAVSPARERELTCSDGTTFTGEQVRMGFGRPPHTWRNVNPGTFPTAFTFHAAAVTAPDGTVVESVTWDTSDGVDNNHELITCFFIIPIGDLTGYTADFIGFFVP